MRGFGFEGGHDETKGLDLGGNEITVPLHKHDVSLDYTRIELEAEYTLRKDLSVLLRIPFEIKDQNAKIVLVDPAGQSFKDEMQWHMDLHHRSEKYTGVSDLMLLAAYRKSNLIRADDSLKIGFGTSLPTGATEDDPFKAGAAGNQHLHIQFGTGTFDPLLEFNYNVPLPRRFSVGGYASGRFPLYENSKNYRGPLEVTTGLYGGYSLTDRLNLHTNLLFYYQGFAHWDGVRDMNSGLVATSGMLGATATIWEKTRLGLDIRLPFTQRTLGDGDAFEQGLTFLFRVSQSF